MAQSQAICGVDAGTATTVPIDIRNRFTNVASFDDRYLNVGFRGILEAAESSLAQAVGATLIVVDEENIVAVSEEQSTWLTHEPPARQGAKMPVRIPGLKVSIAPIAEL